MIISYLFRPSWFVRIARTFVKTMIRVRLHTGDYLEALAIHNDDVLVHNRRKDLAQFVSRKEIMEWYGGCSKQLPVLDVKPYKLEKL